MDIYHEIWQLMLVFQDPSNCSDFFRFWW